MAIQKLMNSLFNGNLRNEGGENLDIAGNFWKMTILGNFPRQSLNIRHDIDFMEVARSDTNLFTEFYMLSTTWSYQAGVV